jgi:hypothetical protein
VNVYEVEPTQRSEVQAVDSISLFDGSWVSLGNATEFDPGLRRLYVRANTPAAFSLAKSNLTGVVISNSPWQILFGMKDPTLPPNSAGREAYPFDPGLGYAFEAGQGFTFPSHGVAAVRILGANRNVTLDCDSRGSDSANPIAFEQPDAAPRWYAVRCDGLARLRISGHVFVQGYESLTLQDLQKRLELLNKLLSRPGSGYVIDGPNFAPSLIALSSSGTTGATWREDPLVLPSGQYRFTLRCQGPCAKGALELVRTGSVAEQFSAKAGVPTERIVLKVGGGAAQASINTHIPTGTYQLMVRGLPISNVEVVSLQSLPDISPGVVAYDSLNEAGATLVGPARLVAINQSLGPWAITLSSHRKTYPFPADLLGFAYIANGSTSVLSLEQINWLQLFGELTSLISLAVIAAIITGLVRRLKVPSSRRS